ncbi:MAG: GNAT family N-acetyltransferase [Hoeflea sp.]|uniref:GNAT family N-acetyltransferase n=1 Tax=Hoeflea sp. TaxID=1940281 RepID=UPI001DFC0C03|nr:GNAT family N-acetyltransferase [Hoeflea sp.]MBU4530246.1 GNAT family N-acetyltransferase [Alphaproteobacteria bacterium]MBU4542470.1 GNAT family N-acetyltransferase [Alphaproteobacteria bacterium]MBU4551156.1 GNAT family N-acetyltransferase [Alphaproteobacteria bacterium]MBV1723292.1 GNAT family N-acetyltransferase [Hoeflea sp.]MBV1760262.1 GNAT family N-acetyltransferase [Hoeflea sp.]
MDLDLLWRAEMACRAAWPAEQESDVRGWVARRSGGSIRRVNSLNQLPDSQAIDDRLIDQVEEHYAGFGQPALVRVMSFAGASSTALSKRGYSQEGATTTLHAEIDSTGRASEQGVSVWPEPNQDWLTARNRIAASDPAIFRSMLEMIEGPKLFSGVEVDGTIQSVAYGVIVDGLLVIEAVATDAAHRSRGLARNTVKSLLNWAASQGVDAVVLQVVTENEPARALYRSLGFSTELFDYTYMRQPQP